MVDYLARYTHRIVISKSRLVSLDGDRIKLRCKDYLQGRRHKTLHFEGAEFIPRIKV